MRFFKRLENIFSAITFAEAGEHETARQILKENKKERAAGRRESESKRAGKHEHVSRQPSRA